MNNFSLLYLLQVLYERGHISEKLQSLLHRQLVSTMKDGLRSGSEFWEAPQTLKVLSESNYFSDNKESTQKLPDAIQAMVSDSEWDHSFIRKFTGSLFESHSAAYCVSWILPLL